MLQEWGLDVQKSSFLSGLPWALSFALANLAGWGADTLINKKILSITNTRKLMQGIASMGPTTCLTALALQPSGPGRVNPLCTCSPNCCCLTALTASLLHLCFHTDTTLCVLCELCTMSVAVASGRASAGTSAAALWLTAWMRTLLGCHSLHIQYVRD